MFRYQGLIISILFSLGSYGAIPKIKVKLASGLDTVTISGVDLQNNIDITKRKKKYKGRRSLRFHCKPIARKVASNTSAIKLASVHSKAGFVNWNKEAYRGKLSLVLDKDTQNCDLVNTVSLENYISSLLSKEMNHRWPLEALKAQAVAARSYAYYKMKTKQVSVNKGYEAFYDIESSQKHQVSGSALDQKHSTNRASLGTKGQILVLDNKTTPIFFHSKCGGRTLRPDQVWANKVSGYESVKCPYCHKHGNKEWKAKVHQQHLIQLLDDTLRQYHSKKLNMSSRRITIVPDKKRNSSLRVYDGEELKFVQKSRLRVKVGYNKALSNNYRLTKRNNFIYLEGQGRGHGVGMCQYGALEMAKRGYNYKQILAHYFPNHKLKVIY